MLILASTSDIIRIVTGTAVTTITVHATWADNAAGSITPGRTNTGITGATTTTVVASPAGSTYRNVKLLSIANNSASTNTTITVQHYDGTTSIDLFTATLLAGETIYFTEYGGFFHCDSQGAKYRYAGPDALNLSIAGALAETMARELVTETNTTVAASGTLNMQLIALRAGWLVSNITLCSATTAAGTPTHYLFGLYDSALNRLATSADQTSTAWAANTVKTLAMTAPYRVPTSGIYYIGYFMAAGTVPTLKGNTAKTGAQLAGTAPILQGTSSTGLTTSLPNPAAAVTVSTASFWAAVT